MPVPQTFTVGALGFSTNWSASSMQTFRFPWPAPSPRTAEPSMYAFWLMSSFAFRVRAAVVKAGTDKRRQAKTSAEVCIADSVVPDESAGWDRQGVWGLKT